MKQPVGDIAYMTEHMRYLLRLLDDPPIRLASTPMDAHLVEGGVPTPKEKKPNKNRPPGVPTRGVPSPTAKKIQNNQPPGVPTGWGVLTVLYWTVQL